MSHAKAIVQSPYPYFSSCYLLFVVIEKHHWSVKKRKGEEDFSLAKIYSLLMKKNVINSWKISLIKRRHLPEQETSFNESLP